MAEQDTPKTADAEVQPEPQPDALAESSADYDNYQPPEKQRSPIWRKVAIVGATLVVLTAVASGVYWFVIREKPASQPAKTSETSQGENAASQAASQITTKTKHYVSQNFRLEFDYPEDWSAGEDNAEQITLLSPDLKMTSTEGKPIIGQVEFSIRPSGAKVAGIDGGKATAVRDSLKIDYAKPTSAQRASTYVSLLRYGDTAESLDGVFITGDLGYQKDQNVLKADIDKVNPIINFDFYLCPDSGCVEVSGISGIGIATWDNTGISEPILDMLKSLVIN